MRWCRAKTDFPTAVSARSWMQKGVFYAVTNQSERLSAGESEARLHGLTSLRALRGQGRSGRQLCVQALDLGVLGEQKLLKAADLRLWGGHTVRSLGISDMQLCKYILRVPEHVCTGDAQKQDIHSFSNSFCTYFYALTCIFCQYLQHTSNTPK